MFSIKFHNNVCNLEETSTYHVQTVKKHAVSKQALLTAMPRRAELTAIPLNVKRVTIFNTAYFCCKMTYPLRDQLVSKIPSRDKKWLPNTCAQSYILLKFWFRRLF